MVPLRPQPIIWKGQTYTVEQLARGVESKGIPGQPILSPAPSLRAVDGDATPGIVSESQPPAGNPT